MKHCLLYFGDAPDLYEAFLLDLFQKYPPARSGFFVNCSFFLAARAFSSRLIATSAGAGEPPAVRGLLPQAERRHF
jgi:hypothetical protein